MSSHDNPERSFLAVVLLLAPLVLLFPIATANFARAAVPPVLDAAEAGVLPTVPDWTVEGNEANAALGACLATAGDVNGDGFSDVVVGVPGHRENNLRVGQVCVYYGSAEGPSTIPSWTVNGTQETSFPSSVSTAGDVNGDGCDDLLIGDMFDSNGQANEGRAYLYLGSPSGLATTPSWIGEPNEANRSFGLCVAPAGDVNGDGFDDVIIGGPVYFGTSAGRAYVYLGSPAGLSDTPVWTATGEMAPDFFGWSCGTAGDVNGDGFDDVVVGAALFSINWSKQGKAYVYLGGPDGPSPTPIWVRAGETDEWLGISVSTAGDVNGDGYSDVLIGAMAMGSPIPDEGRAYVFYGSASGPAQDPAWMAAGGDPSMEFGFSVATAGDVDGNGYADVVIGARMYSGGGMDQAGQARVYLGSAGGLAAAPAWLVNGTQTGEDYGACVATAGDVNGDGHSEVLAGAPGYRHPLTVEGAAFLYLGSSAGPKDSPSWTVEGNQDGAELGSVVASAGDINGDGYGDALVSAPLQDNGQADEGWTGLYLGSASGLAPAPAWIRESNQAGARSGAATAAAGDVNGDGYGDVIVGAPFYDAGQVDEGRAYLFSGTAGTLTTFPTWRAESDQDSAALGSSVAGAGDVNGDGYADVVVGAPGYDGAQVNQGRAFLFQGSSGGLALAPAWQADGTQQNGFFAGTVAAAGDVNGDGYGDVLIGDPLFDAAQGDAGKVSLYLGSSSGLGTTAAWTVEGDQAYAQYGFSIASAGDVNGDGFSDVLIAAPFQDNGMIDQGRVDLYLGSPSGLSAYPAWTRSGDTWACGFGYSVASAGDVDGDGFSDVLIGALWWGSFPAGGGQASLYLGSTAGLGDSPAWTTTGGQPDMLLGSSVACAGDVDGDGASDLLIGASLYDGGQNDEGKAFLFSGNAGLPRIPQQLRVHTAAPIALLGSSDDESSFRLGALARTPAGRGKVRLQWEVKPLGSSLDGSGIVAGVPWVDTGAPVPGVGSACPLTALAGDLPPGTPLHWRLRVASRSPYFPRSPWLFVQGNGLQETDLRTAATDPLQVASQPEPARFGLKLQPNPFPSRGTLAYDLERSGRVRLGVYDAQGRMRALLADEIQTAGRHVVPWEGRSASGEPLPSGTYVVRMEAGGMVRTGKLVLLQGTGRTR